MCLRHLELGIPTPLAVMVPDVSKWVLDFRATASTCVPHGKLVPKSPSHVAVNQKEQERGQVKNTSNCYRRIEETHANHSLKAA